MTPETSVSRQPVRSTGPQGHPAAGRWTRDAAAPRAPGRECGMSRDTG
jgi:hypothetical protein